MTTAIRFDVGSVNQVERAPEGFITVKGIPTKTGVFPYRNPDGSMRFELRHPDDVLQPGSLKTLGTKPVTLEHPPQLVSPKTWKRDAVGTSGHQVEVLAGGLVEVILAVHRDDAIAALDSGNKRYLSAGYRCDVSQESGEFEGQTYTHRQRNIRYNHIALTDSPRAGIAAKLRMDSADEYDVAVQVDDENDECKWNFESVNTENNDSESFPTTPIELGKPPMAVIRIDGAEYECSEVVAAIVSQKLQRLDAAEADLKEIRTSRTDTTDKVTDLQTRLDTMTAERDREQGRAWGLQSQVEELEDEVAELQSSRTDSKDAGEDSAEFERRVQAEAVIRVDAIQDAHQLLAALAEQGVSVPEVKLDSSMSPAAVQKAVVTALNPGETIGDDEVKGMYRAARSGKVRTDSAAQFHADTLEKATDMAKPFNFSAKKGKKAPPVDMEAQEEDVVPSSAKKRMDNCKAPLAMSKGK
jgi:uncharacterized protein